MGRIFNYIDGSKARLINLTRQLVSVDTVNPPGKNYEIIVSLLEGYCRKLGLKTKRVIVPGTELKKYGVKKGSKRINLIASWDIRAEKTLHINGHYDVVPATGGWKNDPFKPVVKSGKIYGRGSEDMKANLASVLVAIEALKASKMKPHCNIELSFTPDEETGGKTGFGYLIKKGIVRPDYAIGEGYHNKYISYGNKGLIWLKIEVRGKSCHSSEPRKGINSFEKMLLVGNELMKLKRKITRQKTAFHTEKDIDRYSTMVMGGELWGGEKANIVPDKSVFSIDCRTIPEKNIEDVKREVVKAVQRLKKKDKDLKVKVYITAKERSAVCNRQSRLFKEFSHSIKKVLGKNPKTALLSGATDMRFLIRKGIPCAGYSVDGADTCHGGNEYVKIKSLVDTAKIFADVIANIK